MLYDAWSQGKGGQLRFFPHDTRMEKGHVLEKWDMLSPCFPVDLSERAEL